MAAFATRQVAHVDRVVAAAVLRVASRRDKSPVMMAVIQTPVLAASGLTVNASEAELSSTWALAIQ
jgi:hypothetical protein